MLKATSFRRTLLVLAVALIIFNVIFVTVAPEFSIVVLLNYIIYRNPQARNASQSICPKMSIQPEDFPTLSEENLACLPHVPSEKACHYTAKTYAPYPSLLDCPELPYDLCTVSETKSPSHDYFPSLRIRCDMSLCNLNKPMHIEVMNPTNGKMMKYKIPRRANDSTVESLVLKYAEIARKADLNFLFLNCTGLFTRVKISQLLTFLPALPRVGNETGKHKINVNVVLIDSLSRAHFYRSLPKTVEFLRQKNQDPAFPAYLFEYELFQAVHGHTHQSEHALFSGTLYPKELPSKLRSAKPVDIQVLYGAFKDEGYQTMFLDDLCWTGIYGIVTKIKSAGWSSLLSKMKSTNVDSRGMSEAACKILKEKGKHTLPFFDNKEHQLCFNGKHQHEYLLDYLVRYVDTINAGPQSKPLFSYTSTHVSHDEIGLRVQSLDKHLMDFIDTLSTRDNTISFLFADHGNTYTTYQVKFLEGRQEMYHPTMLVVLPKNLAGKFGQDIVANLTTNQRRLFNMFDFRASLVALAKFDGKSSLEPAGMFGHISRQRTCREVAMTEDAICICRTRKLTSISAAEEFLISEFAIGQLNNKIQEALLSSRTSNSNHANGSPVLFGSCQRLRVQNVSNIVQQSKSEGLVVSTSMDITVQSGTIVDQEELITVQVESTVGQSALKMKLVSFNRISKYGPHVECADQGVPLPLCVCNKKSAVSASTSVQEIVGEKSVVSLHSSSPCVVQILREIPGNDNTPKVGVYEIGNICQWDQLNVTISALTIFRTSADLSISLSLAPRTIYFVSSLRSQSVKDNDKFEMKLDVSGRRIA